jgi:hypothetical protein
MMTLNGEGGITYLEARVEIASVVNRGRRSRRDIRQCDPITRDVIVVVA